METKTILSIGVIAGYTVTHVGLGADVPGKPLTVISSALMSSGSSSSSDSMRLAMSGSIVVVNLANPYGSDFVLPAKDPRPGKVAK